jgi:inosose dehydratase
MGVFCEPAKGSVDFKGFANVLKEVGYAGLAIVEQDTINPPLDVPLPLAKRTLAYYQAAGIV